MYGILAQQCKIRICVVFSNTLIKELSFNKETVFTCEMFTKIHCDLSQNIFAEMFALCLHGWNNPK